MKPEKCLYVCGRTISYRSFRGSRNAEEEAIAAVDAAVAVDAAAAAAVVGESGRAGAGEGARAVAETGRKGSRIVDDSKFGHGACCFHVSREATGGGRGLRW